MTVIGVGIDLVDVERFRVSLQRTPSMIDRMFTEGERAYALSASDPTERFAVRFAAKEAVMKAMGVGLGAFGFHDVEVLRDESGRPDLGVYGSALALAGERRIGAWQISLTHTATSAGAFVVASASTVGVDR
ncbi:holo-ACP synthase [Actinospongicola halichondriae]|uniref:holo-ACP synthase n=1 Tax=Actinospongicola halichondriae TaxID=3236844 RepID=UPI003D514B78